jgi:hypothetical protein
MSPDGRVTQFATLRKREGLDAATFSRYWADVHGPAVCELPGIRDYWQHHLTAGPADSWPSIADVEKVRPPAVDLDGAPEVVFESDEARGRWLGLAGAVADDEINVFSTMKHQLVRPGNAITFRERADRLDDDTPLRTFRLLVFVRAREDSRSLARALRDDIAPMFAGDAALTKVRLSLLDAPEMSAWNPDGVDVADETIDFDASLELEWLDYRQARGFYAGAAFAAASNSLREHAASLAVFHCRASYAFVRDGVTLLPGRYGVTNSRLIRSVGAVNR